MILIRDTIGKLKNLYMEECEAILTNLPKDMEYEIFRTYTSPVDDKYSKHCLKLFRKQQIK